MCCYLQKFEFPGKFLLIEWFHVLHLYLEVKWNKANVHSNFENIELIVVIVSSSWETKYKMLHVLLKDMLVSQKASYNYFFKQSKLNAFDNQSKKME